MEIEYFGFYYYIGMLRIMMIKFKFNVRIIEIGRIFIKECIIIIYIKVNDKE